MNYIESSSLLQFIPQRLPDVYGDMVRPAAAPIFNIGLTTYPSTYLMPVYWLFGLLIGCIAVLICRSLYWLEQGYEHCFQGRLHPRLRVHPMWWPLMSALVVGGVGYAFPRTFGVGYENIIDFAFLRLPAPEILLLSVMKYISWVYSSDMGYGLPGP